MSRPLQILTMVIALLLVTVSLEDTTQAAEVFLMLGGCNSGSTSTVCDAGDRSIVHFGAAHRWPLGNGWHGEIRYDHFSHYDAGELDPGNSKFLQQNTGFVDAWTAGVVYEW